MILNEWSKLESIQKQSPDWEIKHLISYSTSEKSSFVNGPFGSDLLSSELVDKGQPVVYIRDIKNGQYQRKSKVCVTLKKYESLPACQVSEGDVIITKVGDPPCESAVYTDKNFGIVTQDVIRIKTSETFVSEFLSNLLNSDIGKRQVKRIKIAGTRERVSLTDFKKVRLPIPPLPEQKKIAEILSTWDKAIRTTEQLLANSQQQKKALMQQLLTGKKRLDGNLTKSFKTVSGFSEKRIGEIPSDWEIEKIDKHLWFQEGPGVRTHQFTESGVKLFNGTNIQQNIVSLINTTNHISEDEAYGSYKHFLADEGDLVIACSGISVDKFNEKISFLKKEHLPLCMNTSTMRFKVLENGSVDLHYFYYFMQTMAFKNQIRRQATGSAQLNFGPSHIKKCLLILPSLEEQHKISAVLTAADAEIDTLKQKLDHLKQEKKALMQQLLTGKIRVKVSSKD